MKSFLPILFFLPSILCAQNQPGQIVIGKIDSMYSTILNEQRQIWVHVPGTEEQKAITGQRYPVVYLLDGDGHFSSVVGMIQQLSTVNGNTIIPEMIVVGIPNTNRARDLTPSHVDSGPGSQSTGGGGNFLKFLETELIPYIDSVYPSLPYRIYIGHSFGGLSVLHALIQNPALFNSYIAIDPSMWWNNRSFLAETKKALAAKQFIGKSLFLGIANTMEEGMDTVMVLKDTAQSTEHIRSILDLAKEIESSGHNGLKSKSVYYHQDNHTSVPLIAEYDALRFIFKDFSLKINRQDYKDNTESLAEKFKNHYLKLSRQYGVEFKPPESRINGLGHYLMYNRQLIQARDLFKLNVGYYPDSYKACEALGDALDALGDTKQAIDYYQKALALKETIDIRLKLDMLNDMDVKVLTNSLHKYAGNFDLDGTPARVFVGKGILKIYVRSQRIFELVPAKGPDEFTVKDMEGYVFRFEMEEGRSVALYSIRPGGSLKGVLIK